jgi:hypothetical protein
MPTVPTPVPGVPAEPLFRQPWPDQGDGFRLFQLGFVTDDLLGAAARWAAVLGVGPFHVLPARETDATLHGEPAPLEMQVAVAQAGPVQIELITQRCDRPSIYREMQATAGGGALHQICTVAPDYEATCARYQALGYDLACELRGGGQRVAFFDTVDDFGFWTEVAEEVPGFLDAVAGIAETCRTWDGTDPVRILTRDGYRVP